MRKSLLFLIILTSYSYLSAMNNCIKSDTITKTFKFNDSTAIRFVSVKRQIREILVYTINNETLLMSGYQYYFNNNKLIKICLIDTSFYFRRFNILIDDKNHLSKIEDNDSDTLFTYYKTKIPEWGKALPDCSFESGSLIYIKQSYLIINYNCNGEITNISENISINSGNTRNGIELYHKNLKLFGTVINVNGKNIGPSLILTKKGKLKSFNYYHPEGGIITKLSLKELRNRKSYGYILLD